MAARRHRIILAPPVLAPSQNIRVGSLVPPSKAFLCKLRPQSYEKRHKRDTAAYSPHPADPSDTTLPQQHLHPAQRIAARRAIERTITQAQPKRFVTPSATRHYGSRGSWWDILAYLSNSIVVGLQNFTCFRLRCHRCQCLLRTQPAKQHVCVVRQLRVQASEQSVFTAMCGL